MNIHIKKNKIILKGTNEEIKDQLNNMIQYIHSRFFLNHDKMMEKYSHINVPVSFDDDNGDYYPNDTNYRDELKFVSCDIKDKKYIYDFWDKKIFDDVNKCSELHTYLCKHSPKKLYIGNIKTIKINRINKIPECCKDCRGRRKILRLAVTLLEKIFLY